MSNFQFFAIVAFVIIYGGNMSNGSRLVPAIFFILCALYSAASGI